MRRPLHLSPLFLSIILVLASVSAQAAGKETAAAAACQKGETWRFSAQVPKSAARAFSEFLAGTHSPIKAFSQALSVRKNARNAETRMLAEYWAARALLQAGNEISAAAGFNFVAGEFPDSTTLGIQVAALDCLNSLDLTQPITIERAPLIPQLRRMLTMTDDPAKLRALWRFSGGIFRDLLAKDAPKVQIDSALAMLDGAGVHEHFARGLYAAYNNDHEGTIQNLRRIKQKSSDKIPELAQFSDRLHLLTARALYSTKRFSEAFEELKMIDKTSNELVQSLSELAWSALQARRYPEAIGAALSLQSGGLRRTFAPESPMIMAMALNEICQYPESLRATDAFRKSYEATYHWLSSWNEAQPKPKLYPLAVDYLKRRKSQVPERLLSEWVKSPGFLASQEEVNLITKVRSNIKAQSRAATQEQKRMGKQLETDSKLLLARLMKLKKLKQGPESIAHELSVFHRKVAEYRDFRRAASSWRSIVDNVESGSGARLRTLYSQLEFELSRKNARMFKLLDEVAENTQLIEAEIYHGASKDIVWQNAHPDYRDVLLSAKGGRSIPSKPVWEWGRGSPLASEWSEIWEDEIGSFKANLFDNCSSKQKYLAIKRLLPRAIAQAQAQAQAKQESQ